MNLIGKNKNCGKFPNIYIIPNKKLVKEIYMYTKIIQYKRKTLKYKILKPLSINFNNTKKFERETIPPVKITT